MIYSIEVKFECRSVLAQMEVTDPGFPKWGDINLRKRGTNIGKYFAEKCMKIKEIGPRVEGAFVPIAPPQRFC